MSIANPLTAKGQRSAARVLQAATTVLARDGYGGASLGRIAEEAGVDKRNILYYYGTREALLVRVVQTVGERVADYIDAAVGPTDSPQQLADSLVDTMWSGITSAPELARAYFALIGSGNPRVEEALHQLKSAYLHLIARQLQNHDHTTWRLRGDLPGIATLCLAALRGLLLEWTETGDTPTIAASLQRCKHTIADQYEPR